MVTMARDGRCRGRERTGASRLGCLSLTLALAVVGVPRKVVPADYCQNGYDAAMSPHLPGGLEELGGSKQKKQEVAGKGRPWPFQDGAPKSKRGGDKVPCCNPRCPGVAGRQSFRYDYAIGKGQSK